LLRYSSRRRRRGGGERDVIGFSRGCQIQETPPKRKGIGEGLRAAATPSHGFRVTKDSWGFRRGGLGFFAVFGQIGFSLALGKQKRTVELERRGGRLHPGISATAGSRGRCGERQARRLGPCHTKKTKTRSKNEGGGFFFFFSPTAWKGEDSRGGGRAEGQIARAAGWERLFGEVGNEAGGGEGQKKKKGKNGRKGKERGGEKKGKKKKKKHPLASTGPSWIWGQGEWGERPEGNRKKGPGAGKNIGAKAKKGGGPKSRRLGRRIRPRVEK